MLELMLDGVLDKRRSCRYEPVVSSLFLGWWEDPEFRNVPAELKNLSAGGALVELSVAPPVGERIWVCLSTSVPGDWAEAEVVSVDDDGPPYRLRLRFVGHCPYELYSAAVFGISVGG